ncbi:MAG TPA: M14 family metallopeptidase, partial [Sphingomicrobium sp.]
MLILLAALAAAAPADLAAPLPPLVPWNGASERLIAAPTDPWITPAEARNFDATPSFDETRAYIDRLVAAAPQLLRIETFGRTSEGRELYAVIASRADGRRRPAVLAQAGIHAGEIDGKDAGLMLLRDIAAGGKARLLDNADLVFVPIFNADGHERSSRFSRPNQRGPREQGWRTTARNLNLNRDYLKADTPEMQAMLAFLRRIDPALYIDVHVTDGVDYQYDITYGFLGWNGRYAQSPAIGRWLDQQLRPNMDRALTRAGHIPGPLIFAADDRNPAAGIVDFAAQPRLSHAYGDLARVPTVLVENHSLKPYR